jgi:hypothetical protein
MFTIGLIISEFGDGSFDITSCGQKSRIRVETGDDNPKFHFCLSVLEITLQ